MLYAVKLQGYLVAGGGVEPPSFFYEKNFAIVVAARLLKQKSFFAFLHATVAPTRDICYGKGIRTPVPTAISLGFPGPLEDTIEEFYLTQPCLETPPQFDFG